MTESLFPQGEGKEGSFLGAWAVTWPRLRWGHPGLALPGVGRGEEEGPHLPMKQHPVQKLGG